MLPTEVVARALYEATTFAARFPSLALPIARLTRHGVVVDRGTDVLIEGFPRSGNSFAVAAFAVAQPQPVRIAHHLHAPGHVIAAVRLRVPALVVIRDPEDAVVEFVLVKPALSVGQALRGYARFHEPLLPHRRGFVVGTHSEVVADLGSVIGRLNRRFGTSFAEFEPTEESLRASEEGVAAYWAGREGPGLPVLGRTSAPTVDADERRGRLVERYRARELAGLRARARRAHESLVSE